MTRARGMRARARAFLGMAWASLAFAATAPSPPDVLPDEPEASSSPEPAPATAPRAAPFREPREADSPAPPTPPERPIRPPPLEAVPFEAVRLEDPFWAPRQETNRRSTIPHLLRHLEAQGSLGGFRILAGDRSEAYRGYMWGDSDVYKTLEGITYSLRLGHDPVLDARREGVIALIARAQARDGYIFPHIQLAEPAYRHFSEERTRTCESYSLGHLIESAAEHRRLTARDDFIAVARRAAALLRSAHASGLLPASGHPEVELALVKLYRATGDRESLDLAAALVEGARRTPSIWSNGKPPLGHPEAMGHAVAMMYLYSAATDVAALTANRELMDLIVRKWESMVGRKLYITGGVGQARYHEGFPPDWELPNASAYCETCAAIANVLWQHRLFLVHGDARYIDVLERALYNNVAAGVSLDGEGFFYVNPLSSDGKAGFNQGSPGRFAWTGCPCCPTNVVRFLPRVGEYAYSVRGSEVYVNLFLAGRARIDLGGEGGGPAAGVQDAAAGGSLVLRQETRYPWDGRVRITIEEAPPSEVTIRVRIPGWSRGRPVPTDLYRYLAARPTGSAFRLRVREGAGEGEGALSGRDGDAGFAEERGYAVLRRAWGKGDRIDIDLPMPARRVLARDEVKDDVGRVAVERGPLVYCAEGVDNGGRALGLGLPDGAALEPAAMGGGLGDAVVLRGRGTFAPPGSGKASERESVDVTLVPYALWSHRGAGEMAVWLER